MTDAEMTIDLPRALRDTLSTLDSTSLGGARSAALLLLGYACAATVNELVALDIGDLTSTDGGLLVRNRRQRPEQSDVVALSRGADSDACAVVAVERLIARLGAEGRTEGPLFVYVDLRCDRWVERSGAPGGSPTRDPSGRIRAGTAVNLVIRCGRAAGIRFPSAWAGCSLRDQFAAATAVTSAGAAR